MKTCRSVACELCGTRHPASEEGVTPLRFLNKQIIEECCGKIVDVAYADFGEDFAIAFLKDFAKNPSDPRFSYLRFILPDILGEALSRAEEISKEAVRAKEQAAKIKEAIEAAQKD